MREVGSSKCRLGDRAPTLHKKTAAKVVARNSSGTDAGLARETRNQPPHERTSERLARREGGANAVPEMPACEYQRRNPTGGNAPRVGRWMAVLRSLTKENTMGILPKRVPQASNPPGSPGPKAEVKSGDQITNRPLPTDSDGRDLIQVDNPLGTPGPDEIQR